MIQTCLTTRDASAAETAVPENPIPAIKKNHFQFSQRRSCKDLRLVGGSNRFACRKSYPNMAAARFLPELIRTETDAAMQTEIGPSVTTAHLFWPNQRRKPALSLPNSQPNSNFLRSQCKRGAYGLANATACA